MKFFYPLALALAAVVAAQDDQCDAANIVTACLDSETDKVKACDPADWDCQCAAHQAVATCYNNCPKDARALPAQQEVTIYCQQASIHGSAAQRKTQTVAASATGFATNAAASNSASPTAATPTADEAASTAASSSTATSTPNMGVGQLARNTGGVLLAVAGVVAAVL
ncbi:hypothetical protein CTA1_5817 [Colletotrichum tanaceti]|uniref:GPI anchored serine-threonine rich protein n=1 Tax=Colletotrichum tanaceti TaxID=1306861 RepID=A0A4U6XEY4_9PEZI|nr:hypothetical protein CTA1_5817 [Colletotrichum tanaceti]